MAIVHNVQVYPIYAGHVNDHKVLTEREFTRYEDAMEYVENFNDSGYAIDTIAVYTGAIDTVSGVTLVPLIRSLVRICKHKGIVMSRYQKPAPLNLNADDVWAAACQAQRLNGGYIKVSEDAPMGQTNRNLVMQYLADPYKITNEDREEGKLVRKFYQAYTFKILKGIKLSDFDNTAMLLANRDTIDTGFDVAVITSLPSGYVRGMKRQTVDQRIQFATGGLIGSVGDKVSPSIEVLKSVFSQNWNTHYVTGITSDDQVLFFAYKQQLEVGKQFDIYGTVKAHRDNTTQLNRVKVIV